MTAGMDNNVAVKPEDKAQIVLKTESVTSLSCDTDNKTGETNKQLMRDYVNVSPSNPNESAANCSYAFPQLGSFPDKLRGLKIGKISLPQTS